MGVQLSPQLPFSHVKEYIMRRLKMRTLVNVASWILAGYLVASLFSPAIVWQAPYWVISYLIFVTICMMTIVVSYRR